MLKFLSQYKAVYFRPLCLLLCTGLVVLLISGVYFIHRFDVLSKQREKALIRHEITSHTHDIAKSILASANRDEAVRNLDNSFDPQWAALHIGTALHRDHRFQYSFVLDHNNRPLFAAENGKTVLAGPAFHTFAPATAALIRSLRTQERRAAPAGSAPLQDSAIGRAGERIFFLTATRIQPDLGRVQLRHAQAPILVTAYPFDARLLKELGECLLIDNLDFRLATSGPVPKHSAEVALTDAAGQTVARIGWMPQRPGMHLLQTIGPPTLLILGLLSSMLAFLLRAGARMHEGLTASEKRATLLAYFDPLTGHPNRTLFLDRLGLALNQLERSGQSVGVLCLGLDRFKEINDSYGHDAGDQLLFEVARRLAGTCRSGETFARLSGDEFAIILPACTANGASHLASRINEVMKEPFSVGTGRIYIGCTIGISIITDARLEPVEAWRQADLALYRGKQKTRGSFTFFKIDMDASVKMRRKLETDLREALARNELHLVYQPQVTSTGTIQGVEALLRWHHPTRGAISPSLFIPIAEQSGLIMQIGLFALNQAFTDSARWPGLKVAVNVSANQIRTKGFIADLQQLVDDHGIDPSQFELEITEGILLGNAPETQHCLAQFRAMGFSLALDDFGTGYSSLSYLQRYPIDKIKIDRCFVVNLGMEEGANALVGAIVRLARALHLDVIAEGVETLAQLQALEELGCTEMQGYLFSKPVPADAIDALLRADTIMLTAE